MLNINGIASIRGEKKKCFSFVTYLRVLLLGNSLCNILAAEHYIHTRVKKQVHNGIYKLMWITCYSGKCSKNSENEMKKKL